LPEQISIERWQSVGHELGRFQRAISWWIGDWWAFGLHKWGERKATVESEDWSGPAYQSCVNAGNVCKRIESNRRRLLLSFGHHAEVASIEDESIRESLLDWCEAPLKNGTGKPRTIRALRGELVRRGLRPAKGAALPDSEEEEDALDPGNGSDESLGASLGEDQQQERQESDNELTLHFEPRQPEHILAASRIGYLEKVFLFVDKAPPDKRRTLLEMERDQIMDAFQEPLETLDGSG
jgi:hypothetical protein